MAKEIAVKDLCPNPFRHMERYPIDRRKVDALKKSIKTTDFWDNIVARPAINGSKQYEIAYGHHRLAALRELGIKTVTLPVRDLSNEIMVQMMAQENMDEWGSSAVIEQETVRATVEAFAAGLIKLPKVNRSDGGGLIRYAPHFSSEGGSPSREGEPSYTTTTLATFIGWPENEAITMDALPKKYSSKSRNDRRSCAAFVEPEMFRRLQLARINEDKTMGRVVHEALEMWLAEYEKNSKEHQ